MAESPVRNVIFDFGGVLVRWRPEEIIGSFYSTEPLRSLLRESVFRHPDWVEMDRGTLSEAKAAARFAVRMGRPTEEMHALLAHVKESLTPMTDTVAVLEELAARGTPLYGLSNMSAAMFAHLKERYSFFDRLRGIVVSGEVKLIKPDPEIFDYIAERYSLIPRETVFIDDHRPNVESAGRLGFRTIHFADARQCLDELDACLVSESPSPAPTEGPVPSFAPTEGRAPRE